MRSWNGVVHCEWGRCWLAASWRSWSAQSGFLARDHQPLDLARAFIDLCDLGVSEIALDRHFLGITHAGVDLHGLVRDPHRRFRRGELGDGGFGGEALALPLEPG